MVGVRQAIRKQQTALFSSVLSFEISQVTRQGKPLDQHVFTPDQGQSAQCFPRLNGIQILNNAPFSFLNYNLQGSPEIYSHNEWEYTRQGNIQQEQIPNSLAIYLLLNWQSILLLPSGDLHSSYITMLWIQKHPRWLHFILIQPPSSYATANTDPIQESSWSLTGTNRLAKLSRAGWLRTGGNERKKAGSYGPSLHQNRARKASCHSEYTSHNEECCAEVLKWLCKKAHSQLINLRCQT